MNFRCHWFPWHKLVSFRPIQESPSNAEVYTCSCGREYAVNHFERLIIPWDKRTQDFYTMLGKLP